MVYGGHAVVCYELDQATEKVSASFDGRSGKSFTTFPVEAVVDFDAGPVSFVSNEVLDPGDFRLVVRGVVPPVICDETSDILKVLLVLVESVRFGGNGLYGYVFGSVSGCVGELPWYASAVNGWFASERVITS